MDFFKQWKEEGNLREMLKYKELSEIQLDYMIIKNVKDSPTDLRIIIEKIGKAENNARFEIEEIKDMTRKALKEFRIEKTEELERKIRFLSVINRSFRK